MTPVGEILVSLMDGVHSDLGLPELLCRDAARRLPIRGAGIAFMDESGVVTLAVASDEFSLELENLQLTSGEGPCVEAWTTGDLVLLPDLAVVDPGKWPTYVPQALAAGVRAIFSCPLRAESLRLGVLDLYSLSTGMLEDDDFDQARHYAEAAAIVLMHVKSQEELDPTRLEDLLEEGPTPGLPPQPDSAAHDDGSDPAGPSSS